jgi:hypothetical protein
MGYLLKQSQTARPLLFLMIDSADHVSPKTGLTPTVTLSKNGGSFAAPSGAVTEIANGWYKVAGNATDANTLGPLVLHATATGADPTDERFEVVKFDPEDDAGLGLSRLDAAVTTRATPAQILATPANLLATDGSGRVTVGSNADKSGYALTSGERTSIAEALLKLDFATVTGEAARSMLNALRFLRNKRAVAGGTLTVTKEDDSTAAWTAAVATDAGAEPVVEIDPA